jgi:RNA polymerase sigma-70 factor (ECF subfamily)
VRQTANLGGRRCDADEAGARLVGCGPLCEGSRGSGDVTNQCAQELVEAAVSGDHRAAEQLLAAQRAWLRPYCLRHARTREDAEDLEQEILASAYGALGAFRGDCPFSQWVTRIARNWLKNYYERTVPRYDRSTSLDAMLDGDLWDLQQSPEALCPERLVQEKSFAEQLLAAARAACKGDELRVVLLRLQDESDKEIAALLQMKEGTVRSHWSRGRKKLQAYLSKHRPDLLEWILGLVIGVLLRWGASHGF